MFFKTLFSFRFFGHKTILKYSSFFTEDRCPPLPKPVYGANFSHEAVTLKIRSRSPKSNKLLIRSDLYRLANLVTFHPMVHEITCRQTPFMPPTSKKLRENIGFGLSVRPAGRPCVRLSKTVHARVLKFHIWIPHGKIVDARFSFLSELSPFLELCPFENIRMKSDACHILRTMHARVLKFPHGKIADPYFFLVRVISLSGVMPL